MRRRTPPPLAIVRLRAIFGLAFIAMGAIIGYQVVGVALSLHQPTQAVIGLIFSLALAGLGVMRIRNYLLARSGR